jgi:ribosomal protein S18 acetylase RimI-like enzyme
MVSFDTCKGGIVGGIKPVFRGGVMRIHPGDLISRNKLTAPTPARYFGGMKIRPAVAADVPVVSRMVDKIAALHERWDPARYDYKPHPGELYRRWLAARAIDPESVFLVAEHERLVADVPFLVGFIVGTIEKPIPIYRIEKFGFIHDLWVEEEYRNEGLARQMTMLAVEKFRALGAPQVRLETAAANDPARKLFASCGFREATIEMLMEMKRET